ncbi:hypothetical protein XMD509_002395 [Marinobacterium sp. xm-d-509]|nr:hypothetical protein [Marinobacterium sp. xm-d-509]
MVYDSDFLTILQENAKMRHAGLDCRRPVASRLHVSDRCVNTTCGDVLHQRRGRDEGLKSTLRGTLAPQVVVRPDRLSVAIIEGAKGRVSIGDDCRIGDREALLHRLTCLLFPFLCCRLGREGISVVFLGGLEGPLPTVTSSTGH